MLGLGIYMVVFVILVAIVAYKKGGGGGRDERVDVLTPHDIAKALASPLERTPNPVKKDDKLREALEIYQQDGLAERSLYKCLMAFKESVAYDGMQAAYFDNVQHEKIYNKVLRRLTEVVQERYRTAHGLEEKEDWRGARREFDYLLEITRWDQEGVIFKNVAAHLGRVKKFALESSKSKRKRYGS